ncbi:MAG TPA: CXXX repeat peptide modification system protein [Clostridia bacterium]
MEIVGMVTEKEKKELLCIYERKLAAQELFLSLEKDQVTKEQVEVLYQRLVPDLGNSMYQIQIWWQAMALKYKWDVKELEYLTINFDNKEIYLVRDN